MRRLRAWYWKRYLSRLRNRLFRAMLCGDRAMVRVYGGLLTGKIARKV